MNALSTHDISMAPWWAVVIALLLIGIGAALQYRIGLELDDRADVKDQQVEADRDAILNATGPVQHADNPALRGRRVIPAQRDGSDR